MDPKEIGQVVRAAREAKNLSQAQLGRLIGVKQQSLDAIERGETQRSKFLPEIVKELDISPQSVGLPSEAPQPPGMAAVGSPYAARDFPIYTAAEGGPGEIIRSTDPVDWWPRPVEVQHVKGTYGMYVVGTSMVPAFEPGHVAVVNPNLPHIGEKTYIFYSEDNDGQARATIKRLRRATHDTWHVTQHNPPRGQKSDFELPRKLWAVAHRIVGRQEPN
ncbi:helix-turn-helix domain-containing protein [Tardiphaga robiniae]|uniref:helix-turn-helix domain-containing protein n=1 Tax=Tardiphaga robiniae TaxID=943830 RepID=UPI0015863681|nr:LexA family transcriptional regulator [Tardiphaga robiniae]NUU41407.1 LexA family transcriptional regulator [Tardiphaga robiniae]